MVVELTADVDSDPSCLKRGGRVEPELKSGRVVDGGGGDAPDEVLRVLEMLGLAELEQSLQIADVGQEDDDGSRILIGEEAMFVPECDDPMCGGAAEQLWKSVLICGVVELCLEVIDCLVAEAVHLRVLPKLGANAGNDGQIYGQDIECTGFSRSTMDWLSRVGVQWSCLFRPHMRAWGETTTEGAKCYTVILRDGIDKEMEGTQGDREGRAHIERRRGVYQSGSVQ